MNIMDENPKASEFGAALREMRLAYDRSVADVAADLRIRQVYLEAIEEGRFDDLPGPAYALGFVRAYATYLGLDVREVVSRYRAATGDVVSSAQATLAPPSPVAEGGLPTGSVLLVASVLAVLAYGGWYYLSIDGRNAGDVVAGLPQRLAALVGMRGEPEAVARKAPAPKPAVAAAQGPAEPDPKPPVAAQGSAEPAPVTQGSAEPPPGENPTTTGSAESMAAPVSESVAPAAQEVAAQGDATGDATRDATGDAPTEVAVASAPKPASTLTPVPQPAPEPQPAPVAEAVTEPQPAPVAEAVTEPQPAPVAEAVPEPQPAPAPEPPPAPVAEAVPEPQPQPASQPVPQPVPEPVVAIASISAPVLPLAAMPAPAPVPVPAEIVPPTRVAAAPVRPLPETAPLLPRRVVLRVTAPSWVEVNELPDREVFARLMYPGDIFEVPPRPGFIMSTGNAGGVQILINGELMPPLGPIGAVRRDVVLEAESLLRNARAAR
jgi:cytoskeletal protein RodZ